MHTLSISATFLKSEEIVMVLKNNGKTCALELARPHALSRGSTLGAVRCLTTGLSAVTRQKDLSLVDPAVMFRCAANRAADTCTFGTVCAPLAL